jgi:hypothetical protein
MIELPCYNSFRLRNKFSLAFKTRYEGWGGFVITNQLFGFQGEAFTFSTFGDELKIIMSSAVVALLLVAILVLIAEIGVSAG